SVSSELLPEFREYERMATVTADAYLAPRVVGYLERLGGRARRRGLPPPLVMQSSGGVAEIALAAAQPVRFVLSGPAGGVVGASYVAGLSGFGDLLTFDMGGTSTDVAAVIEGAVQTTTEAVVAGVPLKLPMVDVHSVSAGGGSIAWVDEGGALRVGPRSVGADPGPAAYDRGGVEPTVTDANLVLGCLPDDATLGGEVRLSRARARQAVQHLADRLGMSLEQAAVGVVRVADSQMIRALRVISVERGLDPRDFALVAFGGAGGMHACALAEELGMRTVLVPKACGVLSALGLSISDLRRDYVAPLYGRLDTLDPADLDQAWRALVKRALSEFTIEPRLDHLADLRYRGQSYELTVDGGTPDALASAFHAAHQRRYGYRDDDEVVEVVAVRLIATVAGETPQIREAPVPGDRPATGRRPVLLDGGWHHAQVFDRAGMGAGSPVRGPAVVEFAEATCLVRPGWNGTVDEVGTLILRREEGEP
ncbi:MAG TPA: hydantoinase/oxoprolinase family protein, partial [Kineosporiaceae bacterium]|nr:hydantoinase/oxoprolinase family protein [Kineosporiaceae bacterium]